MDINAIKNFIIEYIEREYKLPADCDVDNFNFVKTGYVDSLGIIRFITSLEDEFNIEFSDEELMDEKTQVVGYLAELIVKKMQA